MAETYIHPHGESNSYPGAQQWDPPKFYLTPSTYDANIFLTNNYVRHASLSFGTGAYKISLESLVHSLFNTSLARIFCHVSNLLMLKARTTFTLNCCGRDFQTVHGKGPSHLLASSPGFNKVPLVLDKSIGIKWAANDDRSEMV